MPKKTTRKPAPAPKRLGKRAIKSISTRIVDMVEEKNLAEVARKIASLKEDFPSFFAIGNVGDADPELTGFRRFSSRIVTTDLSDARQERQYMTAITLWHKSPIARYFVNLQVAFLTAGKIQIDAADERVKEWIGAFLSDELIEWPLYRKLLAREAVLAGEILAYPHINDQTGHVRPAYLSPAYLKGMPAPVRGYPHLPDKVRLRREALRLLGKIPGGEDQATELSRLEIMRCIRPRYVQDGAQAVERLDGDIFFFPLNRLLSSLRGHSQLLASADQIDAVDEALFAMIERLYVLNLFCWHIQYEGMSEAKIREKQREIDSRGGFQPGAVFATNEKVKLNPVSGSFQNADFVSGFDKAMNVAAMAFGFPQAWLGLGDLVNRASAQVSETPIMKMLADSREVWRDFEKKVLQYHVLQGQLHGSLAGVADTSFTVSYEEMSKHDQSDVATTLNTLTGAMAVALDRRLLTEEQAGVLTKFVAEQIVKLPRGEAPAATQQIDPGQSGNPENGNAGGPSPAEERADAAADAIEAGLRAAAEARGRFRHARNAS